MQNSNRDLGKWELSGEVGDEYEKQLTSEHKVRVKVNGRWVNKWVTVSKGAANHLLDCEAYQFAAADMRMVGALEDAVPVAVAAKAEAPAAQRPRTQGSPEWLRRKGGRA